MSIKIKNWKLALVALIFFCLFMFLGFWQLSRAEEKRLLIAAYQQRTEQSPLTSSALAQIKDWRFYKARLTGYFDNQHTFLLDNKTFHGRIGYEVYTPFKVNDLDSTLVDRGFIPANTDRAQLPTIRSIEGKVTIVGMLNVPPTFVALGEMQESHELRWPLRIEYIHLDKIGQLLNYSLYPYVLVLDPKHPAAYEIEWQVTVMSPERHMGYAVQWFALALTLLILFFALNRG